MEKLSAAVTSLSVFLILSGILLNLLPENGAKPAFKFLLCLSLTLIIVSCFNVKFDFDEIRLDDYGIDISSRFYINTAQRAAKETARQMVADTLSQIDVTPDEIRVFTDISEDNSISINSITVILNEKNGDKVFSVYALLKEKLGGYVEVKIGGDELGKYN